MSQRDPVYLPIALPGGAVERVVIDAATACRIMGLLTWDDLVRSVQSGVTFGKLSPVTPDLPSTVEQLSARLHKLESQMSGGAPRTLSAAFRNDDGVIDYQLVTTNGMLFVEETNCVITDITHVDKGNLVRYVRDEPMTFPPDVSKAEVKGLFAKTGPGTYSGAMQDIINRQDEELARQRDAIARMSNLLGKEGYEYNPDTNVWAKPVVDNTDRSSLLKSIAEAGARISLEEDEIYKKQEALIATLGERVRKHAQNAARLEAVNDELRASFRQAQEGRATHRCKVCDAKWIRWDDGNWTLASDKCGKCCDNVAMGEQIEAIGLTSEVEKLKARLGDIIERCNTITIGAPSKFLADGITRIARGEK